MRYFVRFERGHHPWISMFVKGEESPAFAAAQIRESRLLANVLSARVLS
ncbi:MAG: hypothetical protein WBC63_02010 [Candidatus Bipolaricaulia bacterium]